MFDLFRLESERQVDVLTSGLLELENSPGSAAVLDSCMRAAHSIKGAAGIVGVTEVVRVAHALEECFVAAQRGEVALGQLQVDALLSGVDTIKRFADLTPHGTGDPAAAEPGNVDAVLAMLGKGALTSPADPPLRPPETARATAEATTVLERSLRVSAHSLNRLVGLAGQSVVESRRLTPFTKSLLRLKRRQHDATKIFEDLRNHLHSHVVDAPARSALADVAARMVEIQGLLADRLTELEAFDRTSMSLTHRLYDEALACRMRPFADGIVGFPRMVRDLSRSLGKEVRLEVAGESTLLDRDILERLDAPLGHLLRNAIDHGIETPEERAAARKPSVAVVLLEASHIGGMLAVGVCDDGRGIDFTALRSAVVARRLTTAEAAASLSEAELLEFLFLPSLSMKGSVTEISGRGVGLDVVKDMVKQVGGTIRASSRQGSGTRIDLLLPLSLSVARTLLVEVAGEPYAFRLAHIVRTLKLQRDEIESLEGRQVFNFNGRPIGLVSAHQLLREGTPPAARGELSVIVVGESTNTYGIVVDRFLGERELVVQALDARLGKVQDVAAGSLMEDGSPVLIVDTADLIQSLENLIVNSALHLTQRHGDTARKRKRVLVVDDSLTVRELERKLLDNAGYEIEVAVNGMDGWNSVRSGRFDLVITDVDMPRLDGIELVTLMKHDPSLRSVPVIVVSYKDGAEDQRRGLEAGADYFLSKGSFHDETLLRAVVDLIGHSDS
jgi:two-component system sensor histidine kinase and response regulator WspE